VTLDELRVEHLTQGIGPGIAALLGRVVKATAPIYPAAEYAGSPDWSPELLEDVLQDWVEDRLVRRGGLAAMMASAATLPSLRKALTTSFRQHLINRRRRSSASNLFKRTQEMLETGAEFRKVGVAPQAPQQEWGLRTVPNVEPSPLEMRDLIQIAYSMTNDELKVTHYGPESLKSSPILREPQLKEFLLALLSAAGGSLSLERIAKVMNHRFNLVGATQVELIEQLEASQRSVAGEAAIEDLAGSVIARLGIKPLDLIRRLQATDDLKVAAVAAGLGQSEAVGILKGVMSMVSEYADSKEEAVEIYRRVVEKL
jgi:hypothetical protein